MSDSPWRASLLTIGSELVSGLQVNDNAAYIAGELYRIGVDVELVQAVPDRLDSIKRALEEALDCCELIIITGGLGPTDDDLTREAVAETLSLPLELVPETERLLIEKLGEPGPGQLRQAYVPAGAQTIPATTGTAPGIRIDKSGKIIYLLPGVPYEMREMMRESVLPELLKTAWRKTETSRIYKFCGLGEVNIEERVKPLLPKDISLSLLPRIGLVFAQVRADQQTIDRLDSEIPRMFPEYYGRDGDTLPGVIGRLLVERELTMSVAESCTGGLVAKLITEIPGSSKYFLGGIIAYADEVKATLAGVPRDILERHGAVSPETAQALAEGVRRAVGSRIGLGVTGIAGPSGGSEEKPVGLVYLAVAGDEGSRVEKHQFGGTRAIVRLRAARYALNLLRMTALGEA